MEKMEGIVMKNIQERAKEYADRHKAAELEHFGVRNFPYGRIYNAEMAAYEKGATDQKAIEEAVTFTKSDAKTEKQLDREEHFATWYFQNVKGVPTFSDAIEWARKQTIDEVCNWLGNYLVVEHEILTKAGCESVINELRKAMEVNRL